MLTKITIQCETGQIPFARSKLIELGYSDYEKWNDFYVHDSNCDMIIIFPDGEFIIQYYNSMAYPVISFDEFLKKI